MAVSTFTFEVDLAEVVGAMPVRKAWLDIAMLEGRGQVDFDGAEGVRVFGSYELPKDAATYSITLPHTNNPGANPIDFTYKATLRVRPEGRSSERVLAPAVFKAPIGGSATIYYSDKTDPTFFPPPTPNVAEMVEADRAAVAADRAAVEAIGTTTDTVIASRINDDASATKTALDATIASGMQDPESPIGSTLSASIDTQIDPVYVDLLKLARLDDSGTQAARFSAGQATAAYQDATETIVPFTALPAVSNNQQVSGGELYSSTTSTNPACSYVPFPVAAGQQFTIQTFFDYTGAASGTAIYLGIDTLASTNTTNAASQPDAISVGLTAAGAQSGIAGANVSSAIAPPGTTTNWTASAGRYSVAITSDGETIAFSIQHTTDPGKSYTWSFPASALVTMGKTIGRIMLYCGDSRGLSGHSIGPVIATLGSMQPPRAKTVGSVAIVGTAHRHFARIATVSTDTWRWQLPAGYDPRKPAPLAIYLHPARTSQVVMNRPWIDTNLTPLTDALGDAGFIVASAKDGYDGGTNTGDRYGNGASMDNYLALYEYMRSRFSIGSVVLWGDSMAGLTGTNILARRTIPNIAAAYFICPSIDLDVPHANPTYAAGMEAAFGVGGGVTWDQATVGYNSMDRPGSDFRGTPVRIVYGTSDTTAAHADHGARWLPKVGPYTTEASALGVAGGHLAAAAYSSTDLLAFLDRNVPRT